jgi:zinc finger protein
MDFSKPIDQQEVGTEDDVRKEVMKFPTDCYACGRGGDAQMCLSSIPFFKEIIIMAFSCEYCGYRNTEIKHGGGMSDHATKIVFHVKSEKDLNRDLFKSDSCTLEIPELDFSMAPGSLDSMYTTVEGLLVKLHDSLKENNPFGLGDSATNRKYTEFLESINELKDWRRGPFTIIMDDAVSNCFIYNPNAPEADPQIDVTVYQRTEEQNEELGINDMNV